MKKTKYIILTILAILLIPGICIVAPVILFLYSCDWSPYTEITHIDVGNGRIISIYGASCWEVSRPVYYEAREGGKVIVPRTVWDFDNGFEKYNSLTFVSAENQSLVGVFGPKPDKDYLMIIVDFKSGDSWPQFIDTHEIAIKKKFNFLKRLQKKNPTIVIPTLPSQQEDAG